MASSLTGKPSIKPAILSDSKSSFRVYFALTRRVNLRSSYNPPEKLLVLDFHTVLNGNKIDVCSAQLRVDQRHADTTLAVLGGSIENEEQPRPEDSFEKEDPLENEIDHFQYIKIHTWFRGVRRIKQKKCIIHYIASR